MKYYLYMNVFENISNVEPTLLGNINNKFRQLVIMQFSAFVCNFELKCFILIVT